MCESIGFPLKLSLIPFKPVLSKPSLFKLGLVKPSLNQVSAYHLKTSFSKTRFNLKPGLFLGDLLPCLCIRPTLSVVVKCNGLNVHRGGCFHSA